MRIVNPRVSPVRPDDGYELVAMPKKTYSSVVASPIRKPVPKGTAVLALTKKQTADVDKAQAMHYKHFLAYAQHHARLRPGIGLPVPSKLRTTLTYVQELVSSGGAAGTLFKATFGLNCLFQPYITGSGHQPMGFDQLMAFYLMARVMNATVKVTFIPGTSSASNLPVVGVEFTENSSYTPTAVGTIIERGNCSWSVLSDHTGYSKPITVSRTWRGDQWYPSQYLGDEQNANFAGANPSGEIAYAQVFGIATNAAAYDDFYTITEIIYDCEFYGEIQTNPS